MLKVLALLDKMDRQSVCKASMYLSGIICLFELALETPHTLDKMPSAQRRCGGKQEPLTRGSGIRYMSHDQVM